MVPLLIMQGALDDNVLRRRRRNSQRPTRRRAARSISTCSRTATRMGRQTATADRPRPRDGQGLHRAQSEDGKPRGLGPRINSPHPDTIRGGTPPSEESNMFTKSKLVLLAGGIAALNLGGCAMMSGTAFDRANVGSPLTRPLSKRHDAPEEEPGNTRRTRTASARTSRRRCWSTAAEQRATRS